ncbi:alpha/beta hydrolase [Horticoccus sp. 23ND18S-11]|uniref:alpha/beta hydrolase n=1 Tax=Horticoccus sp. 23ND18S-11 TaxID=3391832 RepID=UPI0039C8E796
MTSCHRWFIVLLAAASGLGAQDNGIPTDAAARNARIKWVNAAKPDTLPAGVTHHAFPSKALGREVGYCIYLPPGYAAESSRRYPVIYNLHGAGGNELHSFSSARALHDGIVSGRWAPMILVLPNGGSHTFYKDSGDDKLPAETLIIRDLIPHIDATYRTIASRAGRAIEGFSMGGRGATRLAMKYPELFCSLHNQAGNVLHLAELYDPSKPGEYPNNYLGPDRARYLENDVFLLLQKNAAAIKAGLRIAITCGTRDDGHLKTVREYHAALLAAGIDHTYLEVEGLAHEHDKLVTMYRTTWFDYHAESFRRAAPR